MKWSPRKPYSARPEEEDGDPNELPTYGVVHRSPCNTMKALLFALGIIALFASATGLPAWSALHDKVTGVEQSQRDTVAAVVELRTDIRYIREMLTELRADMKNKSPP